MTAEFGLEHFIYAERGLQFALPVADVLEIIDLPTLLPSYGGVPGCIGNVLHRDFLVPVIDSPCSRPIGSQRVRRRGRRSWSGTRASCSA